MGLIILYFTGALALSFLCSILEAVLLSTPMSYITMKEEQDIAVDMQALAREKTNKIISAQQ